MKAIICTNLLIYVAIFLLKGFSLSFGKRKSSSTNHQDAFFTLNEVNLNSNNMASSETSKKPLNQSKILLQEIKQNLIKAFGLRQSLLYLGDTKKKRKPHNYMLYMTKKFEKMVDDGVPTIANTVRGCSDLGEYRRRLAPYQHLAFKFDIAEIPSSETLVSSELKVLMKTPAAFNSKNKQFRNGLYKMSLFGVLPRNKYAHQGGDNNKHTHTYPLLVEVSSKTVDIVAGQGNRWLSFDVSSFIPIIQGKKKFIKFVLRIKPLNGGSIVDPKLLGIESYHDEETNRALLVLFTGDENSIAEVARSRSKRSTTYTSEKSKKADKKRKKNKKNKNKKRRRKNRKGCRRKNMIVNFNDLGWSEWLFSPISYNAYYCHGSCRYPIPQHLKTSNHATIQSIVHSLNKDFVPPPCCVPSKTKPLPFLLLDGKDRMVIRYKNDVIVTKCGCR